MSFFPQQGGLFKRGDFQIDQNSTPEMIKAKRAQIASLLPQFGKAEYIGEGIGQLATGVVAGRKGRALDKFEGERSAEAADAFNNLMTGGGQRSSGGPMSILGMSQGAAPASPDQQIADDTMTAIGKPTQGGYRESLIGTESGGNFRAQNNEVGAGGKRGHFGRVQFGQARMQDAMNAGAIPQGTTPEQFMASPEMQMAAENWHFSDLEKQLAPYVGAEVNGQRLDMGALVAMGHLGGAAGARKFVETGGRYNPSDAFGTSLSDYAQTHGGRGSSFSPGQGTQMAQNGPALNDLMMAAQNPWMTPQQRSVINMQIEQIQGQQNAARNQQMRQSDPMYQTQLAQAQFDLERSRSTGGGADMPSSVQELQWRAEQAGLQPGTPEYQSFVLNGGGQPATFRALDMQAQAAGLQQGTPEYAEFMATRGAGLQAGARVTGENLADVATGGEAARVVAAGAAEGKRGVESNAELAEMQRNMPGLRQVVDQLETLADEATYTYGGQAIDLVRKQLGLGTSDGAVARAQYIAVVDNQVLPLLRQTFGAAFTAKEGETLRNTLGDPNKSPAEKKATLNAFIQQKERDLAARQGQQTQPAGQDAPPAGLSADDADLWKYATPEERRAIWGQ